ncbi:MAG: glycoside hydrolase family 2, partial [Clostridia bacterium]|nr:glycoside hydrolase family 2 [Clostridia bacterium]
MMKLKTDYMVGEIPHSEHPHPQAARESWLCLNGKWALQKEDACGKILYDGTVLVPFSPETANSGVEEGFCLGAGERLIYRRRVTVEDELLRGTTLLHFGAVDSECQVLVNGSLAGSHRGGFTPFFLDVSALLKRGENEIEVRCTDEATRNGGARGKQSDKRGGIWYTPQSGIWQTVWLESMPKNHIKNLKITPDVVRKTLTVTSDSNGEAQEIVVFDQGKELLRRCYFDRVELSFDFELWSPEHPKLYDIEITNESGDKLSSYFGMRSFGIGQDQSGKARLLLNGKPYFFNGVLDQGYWSDGLLTYPSDKAAYDELKLLKEMGFNTVRKHIKLEPLRWYYHCDRLGLVVFQDFVNGGGEYKFS